MITGFIIFFVIILTILFSFHYFLYYSIVRFLKITRPRIKKILLAVLILMPFSFILSAVLSRWSNNILIRIYYIISVTWLGFLTNLVLGIACVWVVFLILKLFKSNFNILPVGAFFLALAILFSIYGIWVAFNPVVKNIEVDIKDLPKEWQHKTIVQISDLHLGNIHGKGFMEKIAKQVNEQNPDMVAITGDLFDGIDGSLDTFIEPLNSIEAEKGIFYVTGNHESYVGLDEVMATLKKTKVNILDNKIVEVDGLQIIGIDFAELPGAGYLKGITEKQESFNKNLPSMLLYHSPQYIEEVKALGIDLQLSGHSHRGQLFPFRYITYLIFKGYDYGLHQQGDFSIYTTNGAGTWGPPMRTFNRGEIVVIKVK